MFDRFRKSLKGMAPSAIVGLAVGVLMLGILLPIGLSAWEDFTPTDATLVIIWPIGAVLIVLGIVLGFYRDNS
jgi:fumarate reductase subunit D